MKFEPVLNSIQFTRCRIFADGNNHVLMYPMNERSNVSNSQLYHFLCSVSFRELFSILSKNVQQLICIKDLFSSDDNSVS